MEVISKYRQVPSDSKKAVPLPEAKPVKDAFLRELRRIADQLATRSEISDKLQAQLVQAIKNLSDYILRVNPSGTYFDSGRLRITVSTPTAPVDQDVIAVAPSTPGYDIVNVFTILRRIAPVLHVINDGTNVIGANKDIFIRASTNGTDFSPEVVIPFGESRTFFNVWALRVRGVKGDDGGSNGTHYRVTEYNFSLTYFTPVVNVQATNANRGAFTAQVLSAPVAGAQLPSIPIPDGFSLLIKSTVGNAGNVYVASSLVNATTAGVPGNRFTLAAGDTVRFYVTNANLVYIAGSVAGLSADIAVEQ